MAVKELSIKQNMVWNSVGSLVYLGCQWLITVLVVRLTIGFDAAGLLSLAMGVTGIFSTLATYKMNTYQISDIKREHTLGEYFTLRLVLIAVSLIACVVYALFTCPLYTIITIVLYYLFKALGLVLDVFHNTDQQAHRMDYIGKSFIFQGVLTLVAFVAVFWLTQSLDLAIIAMIGVTLVVLFVYDVPRVVQFEPITWGISIKTMLFLLKTSLPAVIASLAASALFTIPKQYLLMVSGDAALGIYSSVAAPALVIQMGAVYLYTPLLDVFPRLFFSNDVRQFSALLAKCAIGILVVGIVCAILLQLFGTWLLVLLFGSDIASYTYLLQPVLFSTLATAYLWFLGDLLITMRDFRANFIGNVAAFVAVIPLTILCVNMWDMNGVSFAGGGACIIGSICLLVCMLIDIKKQKNQEALSKPCDEEKSA